MSLVQCVYWSRAVAGLDDSDLSDIVATSQVRNTSARVSGMLLHSGRSFFQVIEGNVARVEATFARVATDPRHRRVIRLMSMPIASRGFGEWAMACARVSDSTILALAEDDDLDAAGSALAGVEDPHARMLLTRFLQAKWRARTLRRPIVC